MKRYSIYCAGLLLLAAGAAGAAAPDPGTASRIALAKEQIKKNPAQPDGYVSLALALLKAARAADCGDYLKQAEQAANDSLRVASDKNGGDFEGRKALVAVRLAQSRYAEALSEAKALNKRVPDDNLLYGYMADAQMALGDYSAAVKSVQWMINQHPVNAPGLQRGALLRDDFGLGEQSLDWWNSSLRITSASDAEERAWIIVHMSRVSLRMGKTADAEKSARQALELVANYPLADDALAAALLGQDKAADATEVLRSRLSIAPNVRARFHFGEALEAAGKKTEAAAVFAEFEKDAAAKVPEPDNANCELMEYYAAHGRTEDAVRLGSQAVLARQDIATLSAYALALTAAEKYDEARVQMERALAPGIRDAKLFLRAGLIAAKLNDKESAAKYLKKAIEINASSPEAGQAIKLLANLS